MDKAADPCDIQLTGKSATLHFNSHLLHNQRPLMKSLEYVQQLIEDGDIVELVIDLSEVDSLTSSSLGWFFGYASKLQQRGGQLYFIRMSQPIYLTLKVVQMDRVAHIEEPDPIIPSKATEEEV
jgi:anti-anti-sigma factor